MSVRAEPLSLASEPHHSEATRDPFWGKTTLWCGGVTAFFGLIGVVSRLVNEPLISSFSKQYVPMAPIAALAFLLLGFALLVHSRDPLRPIGRVSIWVCAILTFVLGAGALLSIFRAGASVQPVVLPIRFNDSSVFRLSHLLAVALILAAVGMAGITLNTKQRGWRMTAWLGLIIFGAGAVVLLGCGYGRPLLFGGKNPISLSEAIGLMALGVGLVNAAEPPWLPLRIIVGPSVRAQLLRKLLPITFFIILLNALLSAVAGRYHAGNPALQAVVQSLVPALVVSYLVFQIAKRIGRELDHAEATRKLAEEHLRGTHQELQRRFEERAGELARANRELLNQIEERKQTEEKVRQSEERFRQLAENITEVFWMTDLDKNRLIYISPVYERIWGRSCKSLYDSPRNWLEAIHPEDRESVVQALTRQVSGQYDETYRIVRPDGSVRWIHDRAFPVRDESERVYRITGIAEDITERAEMEQSLRESEARKTAIMDSALDAILTIDGAGCILDFNSTAERMFGYQRSAVLGQEMAALIVPPSSREEHRRRLACYLAAGGRKALGEQIELMALRADGSEFPVEFAISRVGERVPAMFTAFIRDLTERKRIERRLAAQQGVIRALAESATLGEGTNAILRSVCERLGWDLGALWELNRTTQVLQCMDVWCGPSAQEFAEDSRARTFSAGEGLPGRVWEQGRAVWIADALTASNFPRKEVAARCGLHGGFGFPILLGNEVIGVIEFFSAELQEPDKSLLEMMSALGGQIGQFIARKQAEESLRSAEAKYRGIFENAMEGIFQTTLEGRYLSANPALARMLGYGTPDELMGAITDIGSQLWVDPVTRKEVVRRLEDHGVVRDFENQVYAKDGSKRWTLLNARAVRDAAGKLLYFEGTSQDITDRKRMALALENKLEELRTLKDDLAYQNQALVTSRSSLEFERRRYEELFNFAPDSYIVTDVKGLILEVNLAACQMFKQTRDFLLGVPLIRFLEPAGQRKVLELLQRAVAGEVEMIEEIETSLRLRVNSHSIPCWLRANGLSDAAGQVIGLRWLARDITARKQAEAQLATLAHAVESTAELICITDLQDRFTFVNKAFCDKYGYTESEILGQTPESLFSQANPPSLMAEILEKTRAGGWQGEVLDRRKDGTEFPIMLSTSRIKDSTGKVIGLMGVARDITERKKAERQKAAFGMLSYRLSSATTRDQAAQNILEVASELFGWDAGYVHLYSSAEDKIIPVLTMDTVDGRRAVVSSASFTHDPSPLMRDVMTEGARLIDRQSDVGLAERLVPFGECNRPSACMMYVPIKSSGEVLGLLSIQSYTPQAYTKGDLGLLQMLADRCADALQRIKAAEAVRYAETKYRSIFDNATEGIFQTTPEGRYLSANPALARMFGYGSPEELMAEVTDIERQTYVSAIRRNEFKRELEQHGSVRNFEAERYRKDGSKFWISINARTVRDSSETGLYYEGTNQDITARKTAERVLRESEEKFRALFESARAGIALHDADGHLMLTNPAYQQMLGYEAEELCQLGVKRVTHPDDVAEGQRLFQDLHQSKRDHYVREKRYLHKDGHLVWGRASASAIRTDGQLQFIMSMVEDITERKRAEEALRQSERKLRLIAENTTDVIFAFDMQRQPLYMNPAVEALTGYTFAEVQERKFINWIHPEDQARMLGHWEELYAGRAYADVEFRLITKTGQLKWCSSSWGPLLDEQGLQIGVQGRERDITELKQADAARRELAAIVENSGSAIVSASLDGLVVSWNKAAERLFGYSAEEIIGQPVSSVYPPGGRNEFEEILPALLEGKRIDGYETVLARKDGSLVEVALTISPVRDVAGNISGVSAIVEDVTERKRLEKELLEISAKERRTFGHELHDGLGQYLAGIALKTKALEEDLGAEGSVLQRKAKQLVALTNDAIHQTRDLAQGLDPVHVEANGLVAALANLATQTEDLFRVKCQFNCGDERLDVNAATGLAFYRISQEAIHNALKHGRARRLEMDLSRDETSLRLKIRDNGIGFLPSPKAGPGLGLRTMRFRANSIGGTLRIESEPNAGTQIECVVPRQNTVGG